MHKKKKSKSMLKVASSFIYLLLQEVISLQSRFLVFLFQFCLTHDEGLEKYEVTLILPVTLTSCWSLHPMSRELVHQQFHDTEIILEEHFHFSSKPRWRRNSHDTSLRLLKEQLQLHGDNLHSISFINLPFSGDIVLSLQKWTRKYHWRNPVLQIPVC